MRRVYIEIHDGNRARSNQRNADCSRTAPRGQDGSRARGRAVASIRPTKVEQAWTASPKIMAIVLCDVLGRGPDFFVTNAKTTQRDCMYLAVVSESAVQNPTGGTERANCCCARHSDVERIKAAAAPSLCAMLRLLRQERLRHWHGKLSRRTSKRPTCSCQTRRRSQPPSPVASRPTSARWQSKEYHIRRWTNRTAQVHSWNRVDLCTLCCS